MAPTIAALDAASQSESRSINSWIDRFSKRLQELERTADTLWGLFDEGATLISTYEGENSKGIEFGKRTKDMRRLYATLSKTFDKIDSSMMRASEKKYQFHCAMEDLKVRTGRTAMLYGLSILPDEILAQIFVHAADNLKDKVAISLVCKRFRSVIMTERHIWSQHLSLNTRDSPETILAIAEGQRFSSLKACICLDLHNSPLAVYMSTKAILSLGRHLVVLTINLFAGNLEAITSLGRIDLPALHKLSICIRPWWKNLVAPDRPSCLEGFVMPSLKELYADFILLPSLARIFARNLVKCTLSLPRSILFARLLEFCSSFEVLQELIISAWDVNCADDAENVRYLDPITLSSVTHLTISVGYTFHDTLASPMVSKMQFPGLEFFSLSCDRFGNNAKRYLELMLHSPRIERFCLDIRMFDDRVNVLELITPLFKVFVFSTRAVWLDPPRPNAGVSRWRVLERIIFRACKTLPSCFIRSLRNFLQSAGHDSSTISIEFRECDGIRNGSYTIDSMESAVLED